MDSNIIIRDDVYSSDIQPRAVEISNPGLTDTSITCGLRGYSVVNYARYANWYIDNNYKGTTHISTNSSYWGEHTFTGLSPGTEYKITARLYKTANDVELTPASPVTRYITTTGSTADTTPPVISYIEAKQSGNSIIVGVTASDDKSGIKNITYRVSAASATKPPNDNYYANPQYGTASNNSVTYTGDDSALAFVNGKTYWFQATAQDNAGNFSEKKYTSCTFKSDAPGGFVWNQSELNAFSNKGAVSTITYSRWNSFIAKIEEFDRWKNGANAGNYWLGDAKMTASDKVLTAYRFNTARHAIGSMNSQGSGVDPNDIMTGKPVMGHYFVTLTNRLNTITKSYSLGTPEQLYNMDLLHYEALIENLNRDIRRD